MAATVRRASRMAVNRASNSRFMGKDGCAAWPDILRRPSISNFTATLQAYRVLLSRCDRATSIIIKGIRDGGYDLWKVASVFWDAWLRKGAACRDPAEPSTGRWEEGLGAGLA